MRITLEHSKLEISPCPQHNCWKFIHPLEGKKVFLARERFSHSYITFVFPKSLFHIHRWLTCIHACKWDFMRMVSSWFLDKVLGCKCSWTSIWQLSGVLTLHPVLTNICLLWSYCATPVKVTDWSPKAYGPHQFPMLNWIKILNGAWFSGPC